MKLTEESKARGSSLFHQGWELKHFELEGETKGPLSVAISSNFILPESLPIPSPAEGRTS